MYARGMARQPEARKQSGQVGLGCAHLAHPVQGCTLKAKQASQLHAYPRLGTPCMQSTRQRPRSSATETSAAARLMQGQVAAARTLDAGVFDRGVYSIEMAVRDYELDQFGVVNNAVYASYFQHARHEGLAALGFDCDVSARAGTPLALAELHLSFKAPLRSRDRFVVTIWVDKLTPVRAVFKQQIEAVGRGGTADGNSGTNGQGIKVLVAEAQAVVVWLDQQYRPTRIPAAVKAALQKLADQYQQRAAA